MLKGVGVRVPPSPPRVSIGRTCTYTANHHENIGSFLSLNTEVEDGDGNTTELMDTVAGDKAIDLEANPDSP